MTVVAVRDAQPLFVRVVGQGEPVLLLHGLGMKSSHWLPFIWPHLRRFRFYMPDFRGAGRSAAVHFNQPDVFQNHMEDVEDIVTHFGLHDFRLVGYSLGASTALHWQRAGGFTYVRRYLHVDQSPCVGNRQGWSFGLLGERQDEFFGLLRKVHELLDQHASCDDMGALPLPVRRQVLGLLARIVAIVSGHGNLRPVFRACVHWPRLFSRISSITRLSDIRLYLASYAGGGHDYLPSLKGCETPFTLMVGMRSPLYAAQGQFAIADQVGHCRVVRFEKSGHVPMLDEPVKFVRELGRFLVEN